MSQTLHSERVSVVIPCFNAAPYVGEAIESVLSQVRRDDEVIVIDDGSTDDSAQVVAGFGKRIRYQRQDNQGISAARNSGLALATGAFIGFLDADDLWSERSLSVRLRCLTANPDIHCAFGWVVPFISPDVPPDVRDTIGDIGETQPGRMAGSLLLRHAVIAQVGRFDSEFRIGETMDWVARIDAAGFRSHDVGEIVLHRRVHGANTVIKQRNMRSDYLRVLRAAIARRREGPGQ